MRFVNVILLCLTALMPLKAMAQVDSPFLALPENPPRAQAFGDITDAPFCFNIINTAPYSVRGSVSTDYFIRPQDGIRTRHKSNFHLKPNDYWEVCSTGPFYDGNKLELVIRTLLPIFTCKTGAYGNIIIRGRHLPEGGTETTADCQP